MLKSDLCNFSDVYIAVKGDIAVTNLDNPKEIIKRWHLKSMYHLSTAFQKLMVYRLITQET